MEEKVGEKEKENMWCPEFLPEKVPRTEWKKMGEVKFTGGGGELAL